MHKQMIIYKWNIIYNNCVLKQIGIHHGNDRNQVLTRMENRDKRIVIFKKEVCDCRFK